MERRSFLKGFGALVGGLALDQVIPVGRVFSFPKEIVVLNAPLHINRIRGNFAELLAPGVHQIFLDMLKETDLASYENIYNLSYSYKET